jgi:hypothetical protein
VHLHSSACVGVVWAQLAAGTAVANMALFAAAAAAAAARQEHAGSTPLQWTAGANHAGDSTRVVVWLSLGHHYVGLSCFSKQKPCMQTHA